MPMKREHFQICDDALQALLSDYSKVCYFVVPPLSSLTQEEQDEYNRLIPIAKHRDLGQIRANLDNDSYRSIAGFMEDVEQVFENSKLFCKTRYQYVAAAARDLQKAFKKHMEKSLSVIKAASQPAPVAAPAQMSMPTQKQTSQASRKSSSSSATSAATTANKKNNNSKASSSKRKSSSPSVKRVELSENLADFGPLCVKTMKPLISMPGASLLITPVDVVTFPDYAIRIDSPIDLSTIQSRLPDVPPLSIPGKGVVVPLATESMQYQSHNDFANDIRRVFANFIHYNFHNQAQSARLRKDVSKILFAFENNWLKLNQEYPNVRFQPSFYALKEVLNAIDAAMKLNSTNSNTKAPAMQGFIDPVSKYLSHDAYITYTSVVDSPMDYGTIIEKCILGEYDHLDQVKNDVRLITWNCETYWAYMARSGGSGGEIGVVERTYINDAKLLETTILDLLNAVDPSLRAPSPPAQTQTLKVSASSTTLKINNSSKQQQQKEKSKIKENEKEKLKFSLPHPIVIIAPTKISQYLKEMYKSVVDEVKKHYLLPKIPGGGVAENVKPIQTCGPFLKSVSPIHFPDYAHIITHPMDLARIEKKIAAEKYETVLSFIDDFSLIRSNAHVYNTGDANIEVRLMADAVNNYARHLLRNKLFSLQESDENMASHVVTADLYPLMNERDAEDVRIFLEILDLNAHETSYQQGAIKSSSSSSLLVTTSKSKQRQSLSSSSSSSSSMAAVKTKAGKASANQYDQDHAEMTEDGDMSYFYDETGNEEGDDMQFLDDFLNDDDEDYGRKSKSNKNKGGTNKNKRNSIESFDNNTEDMMDIAYAEADEEQQQEEYFEEEQEVVLLEDGGISRQLTGWEVNADTILRSICKNPLVDLSKPTVASNFFIPVVQLYPEIAESYLSVVTHPMDLSTLRYELVNRDIADPIHFYKKLNSVFQNAVTYNEDHEDDEFAIQLVKRCRHLVEYVKWLVLENLAEVNSKRKIFTDAAAGAAAAAGGTAGEAAGAGAVMAEDESVFNLKVEVRDQERVVREQRLATTPVSSLGECKKLMKDLERCKNKVERMGIGFFTAPVNERALTDYSMYVRKPVDLCTIRVRLEGANAVPQSVLSLLTKIPPRYARYGEFISDLRLVFSNAIAYNAVHLESDSTGTSRSIHDAAKALQARLEDMLPTFTLELLEKVGRTTIFDEEFKEKDAEKKAKFEELEREIAAYGQEQLERLKQEDKLFAKDFDVETKKTETRLQQKAYTLAQQKLRMMGSIDAELRGSGGRAAAGGEEDEEEEDEEALALADALVAKAQGFGGRSAAEHARSIRGFGGGTQLEHIPARMMGYLEMKRKVYEDAMDKWSKHAVSGGPTALATEEMRREREREKDEEGKGEGEGEKGEEKICNDDSIGNEVEMSVERERERGSITGDVGAAVSSRKRERVSVEEEKENSGYKGRPIEWIECSAASVTTASPSPMQQQESQQNNKPPIKFSIINKFQQRMSSDLNKNKSSLINSNFKVTNLDHKVKRRKMKTLTLTPMAMAIFSEN